MFYPMMVMIRKVYVVKNCKESYTVKNIQGFSDCIIRSEDILSIIFIMTAFLGMSVSIIYTHDIIFIFTVLKAYWV